MNKTFLTIPFALTLTLALGTLASCETDPAEIHHTQVLPEGIKELYADQTRDSLIVLSYDSWTMEKQGDAPWLTFSPTKFDMPTGYMGTVRVDLNVEPNLTGKNRSAMLLVHGWSDVSCSVSQCHWLNIAIPVPRLEGEGLESRTAVFADTTYTAAQTAIILSFHNYADGATLTCDAPWVGGIEPSYAAGDHSLTLPLAENTTQTDRTAHFVLTSAGVSTPITIKQSGR